MGTRLLREERGSFLMEALVAAVLLVVLSLGFLAALDATAQESADQKFRSVAASLAQQDMERMRALNVQEVTGLSQTRTQVSGTPPITYTITSKAIWVDDSTGNATCTGGTTKADYLKITSSVTWPTMNATKPIKSESIVAVPNGSFGPGQGSIQAKIQDRNATGIQGINADLTGPTASNATSDSDGCVFWGYLPTGNYAVALNTPGYVNPAGQQAVSQSTPVTGGNTASLIFDYDRAADLDVNFDTSVSGTTFVAKATDVTVANTALPLPNYRVFNSATPATMISSNYTLFPFTNGYVVWGGACAGADPRTFSQSAPTATIAPGGTQSITVRLPSLNVKVQGGNPPSAGNYNVRITPKTAGCGSTFTAPVDTTTGKLQNPGMPYGDYQVCADDKQGASSRRVISATIQDRAPAGTSLLTITLPTTGVTTGACT